MTAPVSSSYRLTRLGSTAPATVAPDGSTYRLTRLAAGGGVGNDSTFRLTRLSGSSAGAASKYRLTRLAGSGPILTGLRAVLLPNRVVDAVGEVYLDATMSTGNFDADSVRWEQIGDSRIGGAFDPANPTVNILGSGPVVTFRPDPEKDNYNLTFRVTITDGVTQATAVTTLTVYEWLFWQAGASGWEPEIEYLLDTPEAASP